MQPLTGLALTAANMQGCCCRNPSGTLHVGVGSYLLHHTCDQGRAKLHRPASSFMESNEFYANQTNKGVCSRVINSCWLWARGVHIHHNAAGVGRKWRPCSIVSHNCHIVGWALQQRYRGQIVDLHTKATDCKFTDTKQQALQLKLSKHTAHCLAGACSAAKHLLSTHLGC